MVDTERHLNDGVQLRNRILWFDGSSSYDPSKIIDVIANRPNAVDSLYVTDITDEIRQYNSLVAKSEQLKVKDRITPYDKRWTIPEEYKTLDIEQHIWDKFTIVADDNQYSKEEIKQGITRVKRELDQFKQNNLLGVLKTLVYIVDSLEEANIPWGVGRGSSVASYVLYLIGVHDVDSLRYQLDFSEFLR